MANNRIKLPESAPRGSSIEVRAMVMHPMENGFNIDTQGTPIPVHIITDFVCRYLGDEVVRVQLQPGLAANPYFSFYLRAQSSGVVEFEWKDQDGSVTHAEAVLTVT